MISDNRNYTLLNHMECTQRPSIWVSMVEIQASVLLYGIPMYLLTKTVSSTGYNGTSYYSKRTLAVLLVEQNHIELVHLSGNDFDCTVDGTTMQPCVVPPGPAGEEGWHQHVLWINTYHS